MMRGAREGHDLAASAAPLAAAQRGAQLRAGATGAIRRFNRRETWGQLTLVSHRRVVSLPGVVASKGTRWLGLGRAGRAVPLSWWVGVAKRISAEEQLALSFLGP